jgi:hypothetical protein
MEQARSEKEPLVLTQAAAQEEEQSVPQQALP